MNKLFSVLLILSLFTLSCNYTQKIRDGKMAFERKQFSVAAEMLQKEYKKAKSRVEKGKLAFMIGESYKRMNKVEKASTWYLTAYDNQYGSDALKEYAYSLKRSQQYKEAARAFKDLGIEIGSPYEYRKEVTACTVAQDWIKEGKNSGYKVRPAVFNSAEADYAPMLYKDRQIIFTSDRSSSVGEETYNWTGGSFSDLFIADINSGSVSPFAPPINTTNNEGTAAFNKDFSVMYFTRCYSEDKKADNYCQLMMSRSDGGSWTEPVPLPFIKEEVNYGHPSVSEDGSLLYFSSDDPDGWGGFDIYVSEWGPDGWELPILLSRSINTPGDEKFPFVDKDTLYFASDNHTGMGGLDVFKTYKMGNGSWSPAQNLKPPINSGSDDFGFIIDYTAQEDEEILQIGYLSSSRLEGAGNDDVYRFERRPPPPAPDTLEEPPVVTYKMILEGYVLEKIYKNPDDPNSKVLGRKPLPGAKVQVKAGSEDMEFEVGEDGLFTFELEEESDYYFFASKPEYLSNDERFSTKGIGKDPNNPVLTFEVEIVLDKIFKNKEITLEDIYYDFDQWAIRLDAQPTLNELADVLEQNPGIKIQLSSHTDCRGQARYNENLSQKRAQSAVDYLISQGIAAERLSAKGYGESQPAIDCVCARCTEEEHQSNRRTTFKIVQ